MDLLIKISQFLLSISILVLLHELGHFAVARLFNTRVEKFYLFFNPWFTLFKVKKGDTEYGLGWLPLGGYVKIAGMIDESMDTEAMKAPVKPDEFRAKPAWQRLLIIIAGVVVNLLLAIVIYIGMLLYWGESYLPTENAKYGIVVNETTAKIGLHTGDKILSIDQQEVVRFGDILSNILLDNAQTIQIERAGVPMEISIPESYRHELLEESSRDFKAKAPAIAPRLLFAPFVVAKVSEDAAAALLQKGDEVVAINDQGFTYYDEFQSYLRAQQNQSITLTVKRGGEELKMPVKLDEKGYLGVYVDGEKQESLELAYQHYTFAEAVPAGIAKSYRTLSSYVRSLKMLFAPSGLQSLGGFGTFVAIFPPEWNWQTFWGLTAFISIILAFMNILPIPALDGGHALFIIYEMITGRKPSQKFMEYAQLAGILLVFTLFILANTNDIIKGSR